MKCLRHRTVIRQTGANTLRKRIAIILTGVLALVVIGVVAVHEALTAVTRFFGTAPAVIEQLERLSRSPLAHGSVVVWQGQDVARLLWRRKAHGIEGLIDSLRVFQGEWIGPGEPTEIRRLAGELVSASGQPPLVRVELVDSTQFVDRHVIGQLWIDTTVLWLFPGENKGTPTAIDSLAGPGQS